MLPAVLLINFSASNLWGGHPWNLQGQIACAWLQANTVDHRSGLSIRFLEAGLSGNVAGQK